MEPPLSLTPELNLPACPLNCVFQDNRWWVADILRKKLVALTPEEWVRQHFVHYLLLNGFPKGLLKLEGSLKLHARAKRTDVLVSDRQGKPYLLGECKAPEVRIDKNTLFQALHYNQSLNAPFVVLTNGLAHAVISLEKGGMQQMQSLPLAP